MINVLDKHTANLIAAGEVVERPASAIKELLENSADAGATRVTVEIKNGGSSYIRVTDDGCGMSREDLPKCILRHATSKIRNPQDLTAISTYGFRGEALAAIASVCDLKILTKRKEDECGSVLHVHSGEILESGDAGCPDGTTIAASEIFADIPARRKFLKKDFSEANACIAVAEKFALSRPHIALTFISDGNIKLRTSGDGILKNAIYSLLGKDFAANLIPLDYEYEGIKVTGYIGKPEAARPSRNMQNVFINGRYVRSGTVSAAIEEGCRAFCPVGKFPSAVIFCALDLSRVDVNVHPAKTEVKFSEEKKVFEAVLFAVKTAMNKGTFYNTDADTESTAPVSPSFPLDIAVPPKKAESSGICNKNTFTEEKTLSHKQLANALGLDAKNIPQSSTEHLREEKSISSPPFGGNVKTEGKTDIFHEAHFEENPLSQAKPEEKKAPDFKKLFSEEKDGLSDEIHSENTLRSPTVVLPGGMDIYTPRANREKPEDIAEKEPENSSEVQMSFDIPTDKTAIKADYKLIGECFDSFILAEKDGKLYIIDKHAAHERILYEELKGFADDKGAQVLLEPITVCLSQEEYGALMDNKSYLDKTGFSVESFGERSVIVRTLPEHIRQGDTADILTALAAKLLEGNGHAAGDLFDRALFSAACKAAVKAGQKNSLLRDSYILDKIFGSDAILYCPHGRPVMTEFSKEKLYKMFKRT